VLVLAATLAYLADQQREELHAPRAAELLLVAFVALAGLSSLVAPAGYGGTFGDFIGAGELAVIAYLTSRFAADRAAFGLIVRVVTVTSLLVVGAALLGLALFYADVETSLVGGYGALVASADYTRAQAGLEHPALLGSYCIFASAVIAQGQEALPRRLRQGAQVALAVTVVLTFSRAIIGFLLAALIRIADTRRRRAAAAAAAVGCMAAMATLTFAAISLDPSHPRDLQVSTDREPVRSQELTAAIDTAADHPLLGTGPGSLPGEAEGYGRRQAHNTPVGVAATLGLPALLALIAFLAIIWRDRSRPTNRATWGGLAGLGVDGLGQDIEHFRHVWVLIGLAWAQSRRTTSRLET
jgi:O-Antigen ligase